MFTTTGAGYKADESMTKEFIRRIGGLEHLRMDCMNCLSNFAQEQDGIEPAHGIDEAVVSSKLGHNAWRTLGDCHEVNFQSKMLESQVLMHFASLGVDVSKGEYHSNRLVAYQQIQAALAPNNHN